MVAGELSQSVRQAADNYAQREAAEVAWHRFQADEKLHFLKCQALSTEEKKVQTPLLARPVISDYVARYKKHEEKMEELREKLREEYRETKKIEKQRTEERERENREREREKEREEQEDTGEEVHLWLAGLRGWADEPFDTCKFHLPERE